MGFEAIEHVCDLLVLVGSKSGYVDQRLHSLGACQSYDRAGIGVSRQYDRPFRSVQAAVKGGYVVSKRGQRKRRCQHLNGLCLECRYDPSPTRSIRPRSMGKHYAHILHRHPVAPELAEPPAHNLFNGSTAAMASWSGWLRPSLFQRMHWMC